MSDPVRQPAHYIAGRSIEPINVIEDWELGFHLGNSLKYISRAGRKDPSLTRQDISKAIWYLERFQDQLDEQEEAEFVAMGELGTRGFGSDDDIPFSCDWDEDAEDLWDPSLGPTEPSDCLQGKDLSKFTPQEVVTSYLEGDMILGVRKDGTTVILKHSEGLHEQLDTLPSELEL